MSYNPSLHTTSNKPYGVQGLPIDARSYFYDEALYSYRAYNTNQEVLDYLDLPDKRKGNFSIFIKDNLGLIREWWFKDGVLDIDLVEKNTGGGTGECPVTFSIVTLTTEEEVTLVWSTLYLQKHGSRPAYIDLYEVGTGYTVKCTSPVYSEDCGETYKFYVGLNSPRKWEIRVVGYTEDPAPCVSLSEEYVTTGYWVNGYTDINEI